MMVSERSVSSVSQKEGVQQGDQKVDVKSMVSLGWTPRWKVKVPLGGGAFEVCPRWWAFLAAFAVMCWLEGLGKSLEFVWLVALHRACKMGSDTKGS